MRSSTPLTFPSIFLLPAHLSPDALLEFEEQIPSLTYDITEAELILGNVTTKQRAALELRVHKIWTEEVVRDKEKSEEAQEQNEHWVKIDRDDVVSTPKKRKRMDVGQVDVIVVDSSTESDDELHARQRKSADRPVNSIQDQSSLSTRVMSSPPVRDLMLRTTMTYTGSKEETKEEATVKVVRLAWFTESVAVGYLLPLEGYLVYEGQLISRPDANTNEPKVTKTVAKTSEHILLRAKLDAPKTVSTPFTKGAYAKGKHKSQHSQTTVTRPTHLLHQTTSEHDDPQKFPAIPDYLMTTYSCQRPTPLTSPNDPFIHLLEKIKLTRILTEDQIGVRAYSTSIASLAAYPHTLTSAQEVIRLPGCDQKIASLYQEYEETGHIAAVDELESDSRLKILHLFWQIWGSGPATARSFYEKGWVDLDDVVQYGWDSLSRVQQIGVKYYDDFTFNKIPRAEVKEIGDIILAAANKIYPGFQIVIVGGYRRGKTESGDVDVVLSHPDEEATAGFVQDIVEELEKDWITHTLTLSLANSERGQTPVRWLNTGRIGSGFDTLDKALVVWQDPSWPSKEADLKANPKAKNPNVHRRVDIIISPWKTVGCAVVGWSGGTTFQRDLRRYAKNVKNLKFDSSGIRSRRDGMWVDMESVGGTAPDMLTAEKRVFEGLGLEWREPWERCTG